MSKCILVHSGNRDNYQIARALYDFNLLQALVTDDFIFRKDAPTELKPYIKTAYDAMTINILARVLRISKLNYLKDKLLSNAAYREIRRNKNLIAFSYSYYSSFLFSNFSGKKVLFQLHPHPVSVRRIFLEEIALNPESRKSLSQEQELSLSEAQFSKLSLEPNRANLIITASSFTKSTLIENGIDPLKVKVAPYGVDSLRFKERSNYSRSPDRLKVLFTGSLNQRKGLSYLARAIKDLEAENLKIELLIIGRGIIDKSLVEEYQLTNVSYKINVPDFELVSLYQQSDVFIFPSLCEGFGHVILEAMATGLPVITTDHTAGKDIITDGFDGFIVPIRSVSSIVSRIKLLYDNPTLNITMGQNAAKKARNFTWESFRKNIVNIVQEFDVT